MSKLILICGPSGSGKTYLVKKLAEKRKNTSIIKSCTTRSRRPDEPDDYQFCSEEEFDSMLDQFAEYAGVYGKRYGVLKKDIDDGINSCCDSLLILDQQGVRAIKALYPSCISIFIDSDKNELKSRLKRRAGGDGNRLAEDENYAVDMSLFDHSMLNDGTNKSIKVLEFLCDCVC